MALSVGRLYLLTWPSVVTEEPFVYSFRRQISPNEYGFLEMDTEDNGEVRLWEGEKGGKFPFLSSLVNNGCLS